MGQRAAGGRHWFARSLRLAFSAVSATRFARVSGRRACTIHSRIVQARRPETRAKRVLDAAEKAQVGERANQWRPKP